MNQSNYVPLGKSFAEYFSLIHSQTHPLISNHIHQNMQIILKDLDGFDWVILGGNSGDIYARGMWEDSPAGTRGEMLHMIGEATGDVPLLIGKNTANKTGSLANPALFYDVPSFTEEDFYRGRISDE